MTGLELPNDSGSDPAVICVGEVRRKPPEETDFFIQNTRMPVTRPVTGIVYIMLKFFSLKMIWQNREFS